MRWSRDPLRSATALMRNYLRTESAAARWGWAVGAGGPVVCPVLKGLRLTGGMESS